MNILFKPVLNPKPDGHLGGRKSTGGALTSTTGSKKKVSNGDTIPYVSQFSSFSSVLQVGSLPKFLDQLKNITSSRFVLNR